MNKIDVKNITKSLKQKINQKYAETESLKKTLNLLK